MHNTNSWGNISVGKFYSYSVQPDAPYRDKWSSEFTDGTKLTDEVNGIAWPLDDWVGWESKSVDIILDLGKHYDISHIRVTAASREDWRITYPTKATISVSDDAKTWQQYGRILSFPANPANRSWGTAAAIGDGGWIGARYVKFSFPATPDRWTFIDNVMVEGTISDSRKHVPQNKVWYGAYPSDEAGNLQISTFEALSKRSLKMVLWYADWNDPFEKNVGNVIDNHLAGRYLELGWLPYNTANSDIASGKFDIFLKDWFSACKAKNYPIWLRPMNEMNGAWTFDEPQNSTSLRYGGNPQMYRAAWRRMYNVAERIGAVGPCQIFVWSPDANAPRLSDYYPGHQYVDWVGVSAYTDHAAHSLDDILSEIDNLYGDQKPLMISEGGSGEGNPGDKALWIKQWFHTIQYKRSHVKACVWFHRGEYRIDTSQEALNAYQPYFVGNW